MNEKSTSGHMLRHWLTGAAIGAVAMYLSDPDRGKRRRALARDKITSMTVKTSNAFSVTSRDFSNRMQGLRAEARRRFAARDEYANDYQLVERVRSKIGRVVSHPHALKVRAQQGCIILSGAILADEKAHLLSTVRAVPGVTQIDDAMEVHDTPDISSLQGGTRRRRSGPAILKDNWPPALRAIATAGGGALGLYGFARRTPGSVMLAALGMGLMARSMTNAPIRRLAQPGRQGSTMHLEKTIYIEASPEIVFDTWNNYENFPQFMSHVKEVRNLGDGRSHWVVNGPAGTVTEWDAQLTACERPRLLAWKSNPEATVQNEGRIRFEPVDGGTRVQVHMSYNPPGGPIGHAAASLFNGDPKKQMDDDLMRMKVMIESGMLLHDTTRSTEQAGQLLH